MSTIDYAIDLGTTNSLIAKSTRGEVEVFKNPVGHKETLPSVVAFRSNRTIIGDKAKEYLEKDSENIVGGFKRKMGTQETFFIPVLMETKSPIALSALVLKELKNFIYHEEKPQAAVITIPASFDTVQSNATKKAGLEAGFEEVLLLQEPIAACLAFANKNNEVAKEGTWLVYDLGGGTFDAALVSIGEAELKVIDHKGDNYLGGMDFDNLIVEQIIFPRLFAEPRFSQLKAGAENRDKAFQKLYFEVLYKAETLKKELSNADVADIEFYVTNDEGEEEEFFTSVTREEFNNCIREKLSYSIDLVKDLLTKNNRQAVDINQVILVGGSTYIPLVKEMILEELGLSVNAGVDPTTAVVIGAAQYAATKKYTPKSQEASNVPESVQEDSTADLSVRFSYLKNSRETEEMVIVAIDGDIDGHSYRITRKDGGFDSGMKTLERKLTETLLLRNGVFNAFEFKIYDKDDNEVKTNAPLIEIAQGMYSVDGQPLPNDICLEVDDLENRETKLELIFAENSILPLQKTIYREISKTIYKDQEDKLIVNILEGSRHAMPSTNQVIGVIEVDPASLENDLIKGGDVEIKVEISESRDISVSVYLSQLDQTFKNVFSPSERYLSVAKLREEAAMLLDQIKNDVRKYEQSEEYELAADINMMLEEATVIKSQIDRINSKLSSDEKYHLEERKRKLAQRFDAINRSNIFSFMLSEYYDKKKRIELQLEESDKPEKYEGDYKKITASDSDIVQSRNVRLLQSKIKELNRVLNELYFDSDMYMISYFLYLSGEGRTEMKDKEAADRLIEQGRGALERKNYEELRIVNIHLGNLLPPEDKGKRMNLKGTGLE
ncbi:MAG: Hsp70 family protein [Cyclobacteriaceae bacterium]